MKSKSFKLHISQIMMMNFEKMLSFSFFIRSFLVFASSLSLITSIFFLCIFPLPNSLDAASEYWRSVGPGMISFISGVENDDKTELLISISTLVGSLGYDSNTFFLTISPYWNILLAILAIFSILLIISSCVMLFYLFFSLRISDRFCLLPWMLQHLLIFIGVFGILIILFIDLPNFERVELEIRTGVENYSLSVTACLATCLYVLLCLMCGWEHLLEQGHVADMQLISARHVLKMSQRI